ncbi:hypothetical protein QWY77_13255 [Thalassotalea ponticola]|uniref:hypothetical protein n=1 Tax=Thalassotalea ponticola TaxID=1523392 RepID=UPI0025B3E8A3|nr:hypothetical protein [Thalassotalea ponticola]MDN3653706.1 hypothetical protein [Thalassotalea ponticola]
MMDKIATSNFVNFIVHFPFGFDVLYQQYRNKTLMWEISDEGTERLIKSLFLG